VARARQIAREVGLKYVYTGNVHDRAGGTTWCPSCAAPVIERDWFAIKPVGLDIDGAGAGACRACGARIAGHFNLPVRASDGRRRGLGLVYSD
jgi:pyruvate formate lyase activating enzyme